MASRRVNLLAKAFFAGRLTFKYTNPFSRVREQFVLDYIEQENIADILTKRLTVESALVSISPATAKDMYTSVNKNIIDPYIRLRLPYLVDKDNIVSGNAPLSDEEKEHWKQIMKERTEQFKREGKI